MKGLPSLPNHSMALTNNDILKKLRVALKLRDDDIIEILKLANYTIGKSELGAFFRNADHPKYKPLQDQILRNFLNGLIIRERGPSDTAAPDPVAPQPKPTPKPSQFKRPGTEGKKRFKVTRRPPSSGKPGSQES